MPIERQSRGEGSSHLSTVHLLTCSILAWRPRVRPTGFEPVTLGSEDYCAAGATINDSNELRQTSDAVVPTVVPSASEPVPSPQLPTDLARIVATWERLPNAIKAAILALVQAAVGEASQ